MQQSDKAKFRCSDTMLNALWAIVVLNALWAIIVNGCLHALLCCHAGSCMAAKQPRVPRGLALVKGNHAGR